MCTSELQPKPEPFYASTNYKHVAYMGYTKTKKTFALHAIGDSGCLLQLIVDTGASKACIQNKNEFTSLQMHTVDKELKGIASGISIQGEGRVSYDVIDNFGKKIAQLCVNAYYCPDLEPGMRLLPPQSIRFSGGVMGGCDAPGNTREDGYIDHDIQATLYSYTKSGRGTLVKQNLLNIPYNLSNNLPILNVQLPTNTNTSLKALNAAINVTNKTNQNLSDAQKELLFWHYKLGHIGFQQLQWMFWMGKIPSRNRSKVANCDIPKCLACQFGKQTKRPIVKDKRVQLREQIMKPT